MLTMDLLVLSKDKGSVHIFICEKYSSSENVSVSRWECLILQQFTIPSQITKKKNLILNKI